MKLTYFFRGTGRNLTKLIRPLLYKWIISSILKENYTSKFFLDWKKIKKVNWKIVTFYTEEPEKLKEYLQKFQEFEEVI